MLPYFYVGNYTYTNEVLFEGNLNDLWGTDMEVRKIRNCCLYDISYQTVENTDSLELTMLFTIEVICDVRYKKKQEVRTVSQKINGMKQLAISKEKFKKQMHTNSDKHYIIQHMSNIAFFSQPLKNQAVYLTVTANLDGVILNEPHEDFWVCQQISMEPPMKDEAQDWGQLLNSVNIRDTVSLFESLLQLVKGVCGNSMNAVSRAERSYEKSHCGSSQGCDVKSKLEQENKSLQNEVHELKTRMDDLKSEISSRDYIINGLLRIIEPQ